MELANYQPLLLFTAIAVAVGVLITFIATVVGPVNPTKEKRMPYESGSNPIGSPQDSRFAVRFYMVAISFILFDLEAVFVIPWTISWNQSDQLGYGLYSFSVMVVFVAILTLGLVYEWTQGGLEWD
ncbi:MAG: NADH-quinone oxidoreductase subunit A [Bradymonadaceae bacterium]